MRLAFLAKYREAGLLLIRVSIGLLFILYTAPTLIGGPKAWAHFGAGAGHFGLHSHFQLWGLLGALLGCLGGVLMIFGLFFRIGVLLVLALAIGHAIAVEKGTGFRVALPSIEMCFVLAGMLFIGPGKYSVDKT
jgi:putative oxidoreductase